MAIRGAVLDSRVIIYFKYEDGSTIRSLCTANPDILKMHGIFSEETGVMYDLEVKKKIPDNILSLDCEVFFEGEDVELQPVFSELDVYFNECVKRLWG